MTPSGNETNVYTVYCSYGKRDLETSQFRSYEGIHNVGGKFIFFFCSTW